MDTLNTKSADEPLVDGFVMNGAAYKASLRDNRNVIDHAGQRVADVTEHPALQRSVERFARLYDMQHDPATRDRLTYFDEELGGRVNIGWKIPRTAADLRAKSEAIKLVSRETFGMFGRPPDYGPIIGIGFLSVADKLEELAPGITQKLEAFVESGKRGNWTSATLIGDLQSDRRIPSAEKPGRLRVVEQRSDGVVLRGAKAAATVGAQGHIATIASVLMPDADPNTTLLAAVPVDAKGITMILREPVTSNSSWEDHPLDAVGEEPDALILFDDVFVPNELVFSFRNPKVLSLYGEVASLAHWHILARLAVRAEIFAGTAQLIAQILGTDKIPQVRDLITEVNCYAATLRAFLIAAEDQFEMRNGIAVPNDILVTVGRLHSLQHYPKITQALRELSGQGLISRFTESQYRMDELQKRLDDYLPGTGVSALEKNRLFNFVWDLTCGGNAMRLALFENVNALPSALIRNEIYKHYDGMEWKKQIADYLHIPLDAGR